MADLKVEVTLTEAQKKSVENAAKTAVIGGYLKEIDQTIGEIQDGINASQRLIERLQKQREDIQNVELKDAYSIKIRQ